MSYIINYKLIPTLQQIRVSSKVFDFEVKNVDGTAFDLTGTTGVLEVFLDKEGINAANVISKAITLTEANKGTCTVTLDDTDTTIDTHVYKYRLKFTAGANNYIFGDGIFDIIGDDNSRVSEIKSTYGLAYEYYIMEKALIYARREIKDKGFIETVKEFSQSNTVFLLDNYMADSNFDELLDSNDIKLTEYQTNTPYGVNDLSANISSVVTDHPNGKIIVTLDTALPSATDFTLRFEYFRIAESYTKMKSSIKNLEELFVIQYLFNRLEPYKLQHGMTNKTLNGVTIEFNQAAIRDYLNGIKKQINSEIIRLKPWSNVSVGISKGY